MPHDAAPERGQVCCWCRVHASPRARLISRDVRAHSGQSRTIRRARQNVVTDVQPIASAAADIVEARAAWWASVARTRYARIAAPRFTPARAHWLTVVEYTQPRAAQWALMPPPASAISRASRRASSTEITRGPAHGPSPACAVGVWLTSRPPACEPARREHRPRPRLAAPTSRIAYRRMHLRH